jgi:predicted ATP-dependent protease
MLSHEVVQAVKKGQFHIWSVKTIDEGIEILTGLKAGKLNKEGKYPENSIHYKVKASLENWILRSSKHQKKIRDIVEPPKKNSDTKTEQKKESDKD